MPPSPWPYPSYAERRWLGGDRGRDRPLAAVVRALRSAVSDAKAPVGPDPDSLLAAIGQLAAIDERVDWAMLSLVGEARAHGVAWARIGEALGVSKQAAQQRFASYVAQALAQARRR